jgi:hypothetical protein
MLYSKATEDLTWDDVISFCDRRVSENAYLDYKENFPNNLEKTVAAIANTFGGIILIGIEEDKENKPVLPIKGIQFKRGLEEQVISTILDTITPPIIPEIKVCPDSQAQRAVVVIRIPQSHQTPHAINSNTKVYVRTGNRNDGQDWESLATVERIKWLLDHRRKSVDFKQSLLEKAQNRFVKCYTDEQLSKDKMAAYSINSNGEIAFPSAVFTISMCPVFPKNPFLTPPEIKGLYDKIQVRDYFGTDTYFPFPYSKAGTIVSDGCIKFSASVEEERFWHTELNIFGLYYYKQSVVFSPDETNNNASIRAGELFCRLDEFIDSSAKFYSEIGYQGLLDFNVRLENIFSYKRNVPLQKWPNDPFQTKPLSASDKDVFYTDIALSGALLEQKRRLICNSAKKIAWNYGWDLQESTIDGYFTKAKG